MLNSKKGIRRVGLHRKESPVNRRLRKCCVGLSLVVGGWSAAAVRFARAEESPDTSGQHAARKRGADGRKSAATDSVAENIPPALVGKVEMAG